jgi:hypothetical protein
VRAERPRPQPCRPSAAAGYAGGSNPGWPAPGRGADPPARPSRQHGGRSRLSRGACGSTASTSPIPPPARKMLTICSTAIGSEPGWEGPPGEPANLDGRQRGSLQAERTGTCARRRRVGSRPDDRQHGGPLWHSGRSGERPSLPGGLRGLQGQAARRGAATREEPMTGRRQPSRTCVLRVVGTPCRGGRAGRHRNLSETSARVQRSRHAHP